MRGDRSLQLRTSAITLRLPGQEILHRDLRDGAPLNDQWDSLAHRVCALAAEDRPLGRLARIGVNLDAVMDQVEDPRITARSGSGSLSAVVTG